MSFRERMTDDGFEVFEPTAEGVLRWVETTRPVPPRSAVTDHVGRLLRDGLLSEPDRRRLAAAGYAVTV